MQSVGLQRDDLLNTAHARRWENVKEYEDSGVSGAKKERPALDRLIADIKVGRIERLIVWKFDRMARSTMHLLEILELCNDYNVHFISLNEGVDSRTAMGKFVMTVMGAMAEMERDSIRTRVKSGLAHAAKHGTKSGRRIGRPRAIFDRKLAEEMHRNGVSFKAIADKMEISQTVVWRELKKTASR